MLLKELFEATGDKDFDEKLRKIITGKSVLSDKEVKKIKGEIKDKKPFKEWIFKVVEFDAGGFEAVGEGDILNAEMLFTDKNLAIMYLDSQERSQVNTMKVGEVRHIRNDNGYEMTVKRVR